MTVVRFGKEEKSKHTSRQVLDYLERDLSNVDQLHCDGSFTDQDVVDLCQVLLRDTANVNIRVLSLRSNALTVCATVALAKVLYANTTITKLDIGHNLLGPEGFGMLIQPLITTNSTLRCLVLEDNGLGLTTAHEHLATLLRQNNSIEELDLGHNALGVKGIKVIAPLVRRRLTKLHLGYNQLKARGLHYLTNELKGKRHHLQFLDLTCNKLQTSGMNSLFDWLYVGNDRTLQQLWVGSNDMGPNSGRMWKSILEGNSSLTVLKLGSNNIGDRGIEELSKGLACDHHLQVLELDWNQFGNDGATAVAVALQRNGTLKRIDLSGNQIRSGGCIDLARALPYHLTLKEMNLANNQMDDEAVHEFASALSERHCVFEKLIWEGNPITQEAVNTLKQAMRYRKSLSKWFTRSFIKEIQTNKVSQVNWMSRDISDFELCKLASVLLGSKDSSRLRSMYIGGVGITSKGIATLAEWIATPSCKLELLFIRNTSMGDQGASAVAVALETNGSVRLCSLTGSNIACAGIKALTDSLPENQTLQRLNLGYNRISHQALLSLVRGIQRCPSITSLNVMACKVCIPKDSALWDALLQSSVSELVLRENQISDDIVFNLVGSLAELGQCPFKTLDFQGCQITQQGARILSKFLEDYNVNFSY